MRVVVDRLQPPLVVSKLEGDAVFAYALDGTCGASTLLDTVEQTYFAFRTRARDIAHATSCTCEACKQIPTLDLKLVVHHGDFVRREVAGSEELTGRDVIVLHRLAKNSAAEVLGTKGYLLMTEACVEALVLDPAALGLRPHVERYEDVGEIRCCLEDLGERWRTETERRRVYVAPGEGSFERTLTLPATTLVAWEWLTSPELRALWNGDAVLRMTPGGRELVGVTNHCMHGEEAIVEHVLDWRPFDYFTKGYQLPVVGELYMTTELIAGDGSTTVDFRGEPLTGERLEAWREIEGEMRGFFEHNEHALLEALAAKGYSTASTG